MQKNVSPGSARNLPPLPADGKFPQEFALNHDLSSLTPREREALVSRLCEALGVSPDIHPFDLISSKGKVSLHPRAELGFWLARREGLDFPEFRSEFCDGVYVHHVKVVDKDGRSLWGTGAAYTRGLEQDELSNAIMIAETRAYRRAVFRLIGLALAEEPEGIVIPEPRESRQDPRGPIMAFLKQEVKPEALRKAMTARNATLLRDLDFKALQEMAKELGYEAS